MSGTGRSLLCRFGLHKWSDNRGGIKICQREGCRKARTYGLTGTLRKMRFEEELYENYQRYTGSDTDRAGSAGIGTRSGLSGPELENLICELHEQQGLRLGEIATCLPMDLGQVCDAYNRSDYKSTEEDDREIRTDGGTEQVPQWCEDILARLDMVMWDRFTVGDDPTVGRFYNVYGWIDRESDEYKDFVLVRFFPETEDDLVSFVTSSDRWTHEIHQRIFRESAGHNDCKRVERHFDIPNSVELHGQTRLVNGGDSE